MHLHVVRQGAYYIVPLGASSEARGLLPLDASSEARGLLPLDASSEVRGLLPLGTSGCFMLLHVKVIALHHKF